MRKEIICLRQIASGTQSCQAPQRVRGWGVEVGLPTLFYTRVCAAGIISVETPVSKPGDKAVSEVLMNIRLHALAGI